MAMCESTVCAWGWVTASAFHLCALPVPECRADRGFVPPRAPPRAPLLLGDFSPGAAWPAGPGVLSSAMNLMSDPRVARLSGQVL